LEKEACNHNITDIQLGRQQEDSQDSQQMDSEVVVAKVVRNISVPEDNDDGDDSDELNSILQVKIIKQEKGTYGKTDQTEDE
jgi:hypothetical protein